MKVSSEKSMVRIDQPVTCRLSGTFRKILLIFFVHFTVDNEGGRTPWREFPYEGRDFSSRFPPSVRKVVTQRFSKLFFTFWSTLYK